MIIQTVNKNTNKKRNNDKRSQQSDSKLNE